MRTMTTGKNKRNNKTTVSLSRDFVQELQDKMDYGDSYDSFLKRELNFIERGGE